jgi:hypothetical protein
MVDLLKRKQLNLWDEAETQDPGTKKVHILFRKAVPEIPSTTYGTFAIYKYPAKFIPQVIAYVLKRYARPGMKILDPFAGYGTVGIVSRVYGCRYELWDINPMVETIHNTAIMRAPKSDLRGLMKAIRSSDRTFLPNWSNLTYWFPEEFIPLLAKA